MEIDDDPVSMVCVSVGPSGPSAVPQFGQTRQVVQLSMHTWGRLGRALVV
jgi:hypothetical protein